MQQQQVLSIFLSSREEEGGERVSCHSSNGISRGKWQELRVGNGGQENEGMRVGVNAWHNGLREQEGDVTRRNSFLAASNLTPREASAINRRAAACGQERERGKMFEVELL